MFQLRQKNIFRIALTHTARKNQRSNINSIMTKTQTPTLEHRYRAPALPENQVCEAVAKEMSLSDPTSPPPINELHLVSAAGSCPNDCSNQGRCNYETGVCFCFSGYIGLECQIENYAGYALQFDSKAQQRMKLLPMGRFRSASYSMWVKPSDVSGWRSLVSHVSEDGSPVRRVQPLWS